MAGISQAGRLRAYLQPQIPAEYLDEDLLTRWDAWASEYERIEQASPKWRLKLMISEVSEVVSCTSWPQKWEQDIWEWAVSRKQGDECPFYHYRDKLDESFRARLEALVIQCDGFLYRCEESRQIVFAPTEALPGIWRHQAHLAAIDRGKLFGFFYDASRPDFWRHMRAPTEAEERAMRSGAPRETNGSWRKLIHRLRGRH